MNGNSTDLKNNAATPSSGGRPIYATKQHPPWTPDPALGHLLYTMRHVGPKIPPGPESDPDYEDNVAEAEEDYEFLEQLLQSRQLNSLVKSHNVILFCNQEQCPCVSNACQITADVMEDIRPFALMIEECRELYALLSAPHVRVRASVLKHQNIHFFFENDENSEQQMFSKAPAKCTTSNYVRVRCFKI